MPKRFSSSRSALINQQRKWAAMVGLIADDRSYLPSVNENLRQSLSPIALQSFTKGNGSELKETLHRPAKMRALHSSAALVVNVFDYWTTGNTAPLVAALGLENEITSITFESQFSTDLDGNPPNLDIALELTSGKTVAIESKFSEWLIPKLSKKKYFKDKYFPPSNDLWKQKNLAACQALAIDIQNGSERFRYLDAPQLLKHSLGLATQCADRFQLYYIYFDWPCSEAELHHDEIKRFSERVGEELCFRAFTYREFFHNLCSLPDPPDAEYINYLRARYFMNIL